MRHFRVLIVDESLFFRNWLRKLVHAVPKIRIISEAKDASSALHFLHKVKVKPDAIIIDMKTQWRLGTDLIKTFRQIAPISRIIVLTSGGYLLYQKRASEKAEVFLNKITEYNKIADILDSYASGYL